MRVLFAIANSITSRKLFDLVLEDSGLHPTEVIVTRLTTVEQRVVRWALDQDMAVSINPHNIAEICALVDAAIVIRRSQQQNVGDEAARMLQDLGKPVHIHEMRDGGFKTAFGSITHGK